MAEKKARVAVCLSTVSKKADAERIARGLVKERRVACVNIVPGLVSYYVWKGKICREREFLLVMKTLQEGVKELERALIALHPYDVPEFVVLPVTGGADAYLAWVKAGVSSR